MTIKELRDRIIDWHSDEMDFRIEDVFSWRGSYAEPCCSLSNKPTTKEYNLEQLERLTKFSFYGWKGGYFNYTDNDTLHFESDYGSYTSGEYLIKFICANPTPIIEHIFG